MLRGEHRQGGRRAKFSAVMFAAGLWRIFLSFLVIIFNEKGYISISHCRPTRLEDWF